MSLKELVDYAPRFVLVTRYAPPELASRPRVHVYGPWDTRTEAIAEKRRMLRTFRIESPAAIEHTEFHVNRIIEEEES